MKRNTIYHGNCLEVLKTLPDNSIDCCITSPPYWGLRDYGTGEWVGGDENCDHRKMTDEAIEKSRSTSTISYSENTGHKLDTVFRDVCGKCGAKRVDEQLGLEKTPEEFVSKLVLILEEVKRVLKPEGTLWLNLGDSYASGKSRYSTKAQTIEGGGEKQEKYGQMHNGGKPDLYYHPFLKDKDLVGIPWRVAFALQLAGWYLRQDIIWHKPNPMPESVTDRCTKSHEYIFLLSKSSKYFFDYEAIQEEANYDGRKDMMMKGSDKYKNGFAPAGVNEQTMSAKGHQRWKFKAGKSNIFGNRDGQLNGVHSGNNWSPNAKEEDGELIAIRNKRSVWTVNTKPYANAHFATFPEKLIEDCILAGCPAGGLILDPFMGAGTTALVARKKNRDYVGIELNENYIEIAKSRLYDELGMFL